MVSAPAPGYSSFVDLRSSYDVVAAEYAAEFRDEMCHKAFDRKMLDLLVEKVNGIGRICDLGCGPGQVARYLHGRGAEVCGIDLSPEMVQQAAHLSPEIAFQQGDMLTLSEVADDTFGGIAAFYSILHIPRPDVGRALGELARVLLPNGALLITFHIGDEVVHKDEWWGKTVTLDFIFFRTAEMKGWLTSAGFVLEEVIERDPYVGIEYPSRRAYLFARKPSRP